MQEGLNPAFVTAVQLISPFLLLFLNLWWQHKTSEREAAMKKEHEERQKKDDENATQLQEAVALMKSVQADYTHLNETLAHVVAMTQLNGQCTSEVAQLVSVLAEGMRDNHLDGNITAAVQKYRLFESKTLGSLMTGDSIL